MTSGRFVLIGVAQVRSPWFRELARWSTSAMLPIEFVKAMSVEEVRVRLRSGRGYSALLVDDGLSGVDRDLLESARQAGCAVIVVDGGRIRRDWAELGASAVVPAGFQSEDLMKVLRQVAAPISATVADSVPADPPDHAGSFRGKLVAVTGAGGAGGSTVAAALAQGFADDAANNELICLVDLALHAEQAMLHGAGDVVPGVAELTEAHRSGTPSIDEVRGLTWKVEDRGYHLLLGLRRHRDWTALRPRALEAGLDGLRRSFRLVVADVDPDMEGEQSTGSLDVEERNVMARAALPGADIVVVVGMPGMKGLNSLVRTTLDLLAGGVSAQHLLPVVNRAPRNPRARAEITSAFGQLLGQAAGDQPLPSPALLAERRGLDEVFRDGARLPESWLSPLVGTVRALLESRRAEDAAMVEDPEPVPVRPGSLGSWSEQDG